MRLDPHGQNGPPSLWPVSASDRTLLIGPASEEAVRIGLDRPYCGFVECESVPPREEIETLLRETAAEGGLILSLTSRSAWRLDLTGLISAALTRCCPPLTLERRRDLDRHISETITRVLVTDTLDLAAAPRGSLSGLLAYLDQVEIRLRDPQIAARRLELRILPYGPDQIRPLDRSPAIRPPSLLRRLGNAFTRRLPPLSSLPPPFLVG